MSGEPVVKLAREGERWRVYCNPPNETWPDGYAETEERALALARCMRFATGWEIEGHPRKRRSAK